MISLLESTQLFFFIFCLSLLTLIEACLPEPPLLPLCQTHCTSEVALWYLMLLEPSVFPSVKPIQPLIITEAPLFAWAHSCSSNCQLTYYFNKYHHRYSCTSLPVHSDVSLRCPRHCPSLDSKFVCSPKLICSLKSTLGYFLVVTRYMNII